MKTTKYSAGQTVKVTAPSETFRHWKGREVTILQLESTWDHVHGQSYLVRSQAGEQAWMWEHWLSPLAVPSSPREEYITALRQLADFLALNPDAPVPPHGTEIQLSCTSDNDAVNLAKVDAFALATGAEPRFVAGGAHYEAGLRFGPLRYFTVAVTSAAMEDHREANRLGAEALAAKKAAVAGVLDDVEKLADEAARSHMMQFTQSGRDTGHAVCGAATGGVTADDSEVTCIACLEGAEEQYDAVRGVVSGASS